MNVEVAGDLEFMVIQMTRESESLQETESKTLNADRDKEDNGGGP